MEIVKLKKKNRRWAIYIETEDEGKLFNHFVQCSEHTTTATCVEHADLDAFTHRLKSAVRLVPYPNSLPS
jgi:hypothetical protein